LLDNDLQDSGGHIVSRRIFRPLLPILARLTHPDLVRSVLFLKAENAMLRKRLPRVVTPEPAERTKLLRLGEPLGTILKELISIVTYRTFLRWKSGRDGKRRSKCGNKHPTRKPEEIREMVIRIARETGVALHANPRRDQEARCSEHLPQHGEEHTETYERYFNSVRVHSGLGNNPVNQCEPPPDAEVEVKDGIACHSWLGGMLRHYERAA
jgi:hypothetical protein